MTDAFTLRKGIRSQQQSGLKSCSPHLLECFASFSHTGNILCSSTLFLIFTCRASFFIFNCHALHCKSTTVSTVNVKLGFTV
jgi:hypothetical protein